MAEHQQECSCYPTQHLARLSSFVHPLSRACGTRKDRVKGCAKRDASHNGVQHKQKFPQQERSRAAAYKATPRSAEESQTSLAGVCAGTLARRALHNTCNDSHTHPSPRDTNNRTKHAQSHRCITMKGISRTLQAALPCSRPAPQTRSRCGTLRTAHGRSRMLCTPHARKAASVLAASAMCGIAGIPTSPRAVDIHSKSATNTHHATYNFRTSCSAFDGDALSASNAFAARANAKACA